MERFEFTEENISRLDAKTILSSDFVNQLFEDFSEDPLGRMAMAARIGVRAKELGCRGDFNKLLKVKEQQDKETAKKSNPVMTQGRMTSTFTLADGTAIYPVTGSWICDGQKGVWKVDDWGNEVWASYYPIIVTQKLVDIDTGKEDVELTWNRDGVIRSMQVPRSVISSNTRIVTLSDWGVPVTSNTANNLIAYLAEYEVKNPSLITRLNSTKKYGWIEGQKYFLPYADDCDVQLNVTQIDQRLVRAMSEHGIFTNGQSGWLDEYDRMRNSGRIDFNFVMAASLASILVPIVNINPFIVCLYGRSGGGKTVALLFAASIWGNPDGLRTESNSTVNSLVKRLGTLNNLPLFVDDLSKSGSDMQRQQEFIYTVSAGQEKSRLNRNSDMRETATWSNITLTNMERPLSASDMNGGALNRVIDIEMQEGDMFPDGNATCKVIRANYGFLGHYFVNHVIAHKEEVKPLFGQFEALLQATAEQSGHKKEQKQIQPMALVMTADKLLSDAMGGADAGYPPMLAAEWCVDRLKNVDDVSEMQRAYDSLMDEVRINQNKFHPRDDGSYPAGCWGTEDDGTVSVIPSILEKIAKDHNFSSKQFIQWADKQGLLVKDGKHMAKKVSIPGGGRPRCYVVQKLDPDETGNGGNDMSGFLPDAQQQELPFDDNPAGADEGVPF